VSVAYLYRRQAFRSSLVQDPTGPGGRTNSWILEVHLNQIFDNMPIDEAIERPGDSMENNMIIGCRSVMATDVNRASFEGVNLTPPRQRLYASGVHR
jgi:hypothetical protein